MKLNWRGFSNSYGSWGKDTASGINNSDTYWVAPLNSDKRLLETYRLYSTYNDLLLYKHQIEKSLSQFVGTSWNYNKCGQGSGTILYNSSLYYNCYNSRNLCRMDLATNALTAQPVKGAAFNSGYSYAGVDWQDFDFAGDEKGLWVIYTTDDSKGKALIGKVDPENLNILQTWQTSLSKPEVTNTFMICGVLYALKRQNAQEEKIFYAYDTNTGKGSTLDINMQKFSDTLQSVHYNPNDHKLYVYGDGYLVTYDVLFKDRLQKSKRDVTSGNQQDVIIATGRNSNMMES